MWYRENVFSVCPCYIPYLNMAARLSCQDSTHNKCGTAKRKQTLNEVIKYFWLDAHIRRMPAKRSCAADSSLRAQAAHIQPVNSTENTSNVHSPKPKARRRAQDSNVLCLCRIPPRMYGRDTIVKPPHRCVWTNRPSSTHTDMNGKITTRRQAWYYTTCEGFQYIWNVDINE